MASQKFLELSQGNYYTCTINLPLQIIYSGKTHKSEQRAFSIPSGFVVSQNPKNWSNEQEMLILIEEIISPYTIKKRAELALPATQKVLVIWDVLKRQVIEKVLEKLPSINCEFVPVPTNITHFFQPLDLTVNGSAKHFMRKQCITY